MARNHSSMTVETVAVLACTLVAGGCGGFGQVNQGRVIQYDREKGLVTFIQDSNYREPGKPRFDVLPPVTVKIPADPNEMGPAPDAGVLLAVDSERTQLVTYDAGAQRFRTVPYTPLEEHRNVYRDDPRLRGRLPRIDREKKTITLYDPRQRLLLTFSVSDENFRLPEDTWKAGDDIRYYYKQPGQALRMMNVTRTDIGKAGK
ncbi:MAG: DUF4881 domain-containing protein [Bryobacteraceae bacterium]|jgi:hypothetical protein